MSHGNQQGDQQGKAKQTQNQPQNNNNGGDAGKEIIKVNNEFDSNIEKLSAILGGKHNLTTKRKIKGDRVQDLVSDLFKEETEAIEAEVKAGLKSLIVKNAQATAAIAEEEKKLANFKLSKKKEFNAEARALFAKIDGVGNIVSNYAQSLESISTSVEETQDGEESKS